MLPANAGRKQAASQPIIDESVPASKSADARRPQCSSHPLTPPLLVKTVRAVSRTLPQYRAGCRHINYHNITISSIMDPNDRRRLVQAIQQALVGGGRDLAPMRRYRFENFARHVLDLTAAYLLRPQSGAPLSTVGAE
jgi:hypothetical protein